MKNYQFNYQITQFQRTKELQVDYYAYEKDEVPEYPNLHDFPFLKRIYFNGDDVTLFIIECNWDLYESIRDQMHIDYKLQNNLVC